MAGCTQQRAAASPMPELAPVMMINGLPMAGLLKSEKQITQRDAQYIYRCCG
jgi:hypothetical protein